MRGGIFDGKTFLVDPNLFPYRYKNPDEPSLFICGKCYEINRKGTKIRYENHESGYQYKSDHLGDDFESSELKCAHIYSAETISDTLPFSAFSGQV